MNTVQEAAHMLVIQQGLSQTPENMFVAVMAMISHTVFQLLQLQKQNGGNVWTTNSVLAQRVNGRLGLLVSSIQIFQLFHWGGPSSPNY